MKTKTQLQDFLVQIRKCLEQLEQIVTMLEYLIEYEDEPYIIM